MVESMATLRLARLKAHLASLLLLLLRRAVLHAMLLLLLMAWSAVMG